LAIVCRSASTEPLRASSACLTRLSPLAASATTVAVEALVRNLTYATTSANPAAARTLTLTVTDAGPGFPPTMLAQLGKPYQSSKGRPGGGLGLFLVVNVARKLGGTVTARNRAEGGAVVQLTLPLDAIAITEDDAHAV
jgi:C4-dicarboxylate-specific signal transduction histidine kinase